MERLYKNTVDAQSKDMQRNQVQNFKKTLKTIIEIKPMSWTLPKSDSSVPKMKR